MARPHSFISLQGNITGVEKVFVTTTTHMYVEADTDLSCDFFALRDKIIKDGYCMAGQKISEQKISEQSKPKMCGLPYDLLDKLIKDMPQALDYVIIEADGAKHHSSNIRQRMSRSYIRVPQMLS